MTPQNRGAEPPTDALFARCRIENPERLARGALDLGFVALVIAPLLLIGLGYGVFAAIAKTERRLWPAQTGTPLRLIAVRSGNRLALVPVECGRCWCSWRRSRSAAALINPPPSRFEGIAAVRVAEVAATRSYEDDHPELVFATVEGRREWLRKGNEVRQSVARAAAPL